MDRENTSANPRLSGLDGLRGVSILLVIMCHSGWTLLFSKRIGDAVYRWTCPMGLFGVPIFFVISGFLITHLLMREEARSNKIDLPMFWKMRFFRIVPPVGIYVAFVLAYALIAGVNLSLLDVSGVVFFFRNLLQSGHPMFAHFWSLSIEEQFYAAWPVVLIFTPSKVRFRAAIFMLVAFPLLRLLSAAACTREQHDFFTLMMRFDSILVGCVLALTMNTWRRSRLVTAKGDTLFVLGMLCVGLSFILAAYWGVFALAPGYAARRWKIELITLLGNAGVSLIMMVLVAESTKWRVIFDAKWLTSIGIVSYSLYLWQQFFFTAPVLPGWMNHLFVKLFFIALFGTCGYLFVEKPLTRYRQKLRKHARTASPPMVLADTH